MPIFRFICECSQQVEFSYFLCIIKIYHKVFEFIFNWRKAIIRLIQNHDALVMIHLVSYHKDYLQS